MRCSLLTVENQAQMGNAMQLAKSGAYATGRVTYRGANRHKATLERCEMARNKL
jgi:hypothetical protein